MSQPIIILLATHYPTFIGCIFLALCLWVLLAPQALFIQDGLIDTFTHPPTYSLTHSFIHSHLGLNFDAQKIAARAELRAWYTGTALVVAYQLLKGSSDRDGLITVAVVLGGFAGARVIGYARDGADTNKKRRLHQHAVFFSEVLGTCTALLLLFLV